MLKSGEPVGGIGSGAGEGNSSFFYCYPLASVCCSEGDQRSRQ